MTRWLLLLLLACLAAGCSSPQGEPYLPPPLEADPPGTLREPDARELAKLCELSEIVVRGIVVERKAAPGGVSYVVEVQEILSETASAKVNGDFPYQVGEAIRVSTFLYRPERSMGKIGGIKEPNRYLFFLSQMEQPGWWLNLDDCSCYRLPDADKTLRALRERNAEPPEPGR